MMVYVEGLREVARWFIYLLGILEIWSAIVIWVRVGSLPNEHILPAQIARVIVPILLGFIFIYMGK